MEKQIQEQIRSVLLVVNKQAKIIEDLYNRIEKLERKISTNNIDVLYEIAKMKGEINAKVSREDWEKHQHLCR